MSRKESILEATSRVILNEGVHRLTLDAVAEEAKVSKGGLLYHYGTKDALIKALNIYVIENFRELIDHHLRQAKSYHEAYLLATLDTIQENALFDVTTSLIATIATNRAFLTLWNEEYQYLTAQLKEDNFQTEYTLLVQSVCDGLWFSKLFDFDHIQVAEAEKIIHYLLKLHESGER